MGLQQVLILLGVVIFAGILLDALRRKRAAARRLQDDDYEDPEAAERRAQLARELPGLGKARNRKDLDPLFDEISFDEIGADEIEIFDDDPIPVLRNRLNTPVPATATPHRERPIQTGADDQLPPQTPADLALAADPSLAEPWQENQEDQDNQEDAEAQAWEKMRRQFEVDPEFLAESRRSMIIQQQELQRLQERRAALIEESLDQEAEPGIKRLDLSTAASATAAPEALLADTGPRLVEALPPDLEPPLAEEAAEKTAAVEIEEELLEEEGWSEERWSEQGLEEALPEAGRSEAEEEPEEEPEPEELEIDEDPEDEDPEIDEDPALTAEELEAYLRDDEEEEQQLRAALLTSLEKSAWGASQEFLTIHVQAQKHHPFAGQHLKKFMEIIGMRLSLTGFYHYVEEKDGQPVLGYSLVNMFAPGHFDADSLDDFSTLGVVLVMPLPNTSKPMAIFERMLATARVMEKNWGAALQDEQRSNLTQQTAEHYRQRIKDFEHQTRLQARKAGKA